MKKIFQNVLLLAGLSLLPSCATMFNSGSKSAMVVGSSGDKGVKVQVTTTDGTYETELPTTVVSSPSTFSSINVKVIDERYEPSEAKIQRKIAMSYFANIFNGFGFILDPLTGSMWNLDNQTSIPLIKKVSTNYTKGNK